LKKYIIIGAIIIAVVVIAKLSGFGGASREIPTAKVAQGGFLVSLSENGKLAAKQSVTISAPRIRGGLQIVKLAKEGTMVNKGDFLVQFDPTEQETKLRDAEAALKIAKADLEKSEAQYKMDVKQLELDLKKAERNYSENLSEAPIIRKEAELGLDIARLNFENRKKSLEADIEKMRVQVDKAQDTKEQAERDLGKMTITAPIPGLVVYLEIWKGSTMSKIQEGDSPWSGMGLIELPDLSSMVVETSVSEVDVSKIKEGQKAHIRLDAIPGPMFTGTITDISTLAHSKVRGSSINVFDVKVLIDSTDDRLKPGMSAKVDLIIDKYDDVLSVPLEAVFERDDTTVVYTPGGKKIPVALGTRNDEAVIVTSGVKAGDEVALVDPTRKAEEILPTSTGREAPAKKKSRQTTTTTVIIGG
jgi:HlyD family secretion protein